MSITIKEYDVRQRDGSCLYLIMKGTLPHQVARPDGLLTQAELFELFEQTAKTLGIPITIHGPTPKGE